VDTVINDLAKDLALRDGYETTKEVMDLYRKLIAQGGYHIYTPFNMEAQQAVDKIYTNLDEIPTTDSLQQLQSGICIIDNKTGDVVALAGGVGDDKEHDGQNRATDSTLQSGSSIKPLTIYAPGFEQGTITPATVIKDLPMTYSGGPWPANDNRKYSYSRTIYTGVRDSVNAVAANTLKTIGDSYGYEFAKESFGLTSLLDVDLNFAALAMGAQHYGVTVREMASAFATFANNGVYREGRTYTKVYDSKGNLIIDNSQDSREILSEKSITYMNYCLTNAVAAGTGGGAYLSSTQVAGKTGTTSNSCDRWFCGYTSYYTAAVWCGYDWPETINLSYNPAAYLWKKVMQPVHYGVEYKSLYKRNKMTTVTVCLDTGKLATDACKADVRGGRTEDVMVYPEDAPTEKCTMHTPVEFCTVGKGVANEYCKHFASVDETVKIENKALLKLKPDEYQEILRAKDYGLREEYLVDEYIYLISDAGEDLRFKGIKGDINVAITAPYKVCQAHNLHEWEKYLTEHPDQPIPPLNNG
jgi:penicillin-binding protein 1A